jgi:iron complex outermembrane receptor protein
LAGLTATSSALGQSEPSTLPEVLITGPRPEDPALPPGIPLTAVRVSATPEVKAHAGDAGALLRDVSGAAVVRNGPQTSILQLRGLSGDRVKVSVDGMTLTPACPNHMDPPLHYAAPGNIGAMDVIAGFTPVSLGGDSIGGTVLVQSPPLPFAAGSEILRFGELGSRYRGADNGYAVYGEAGAATGDQSVAYSGSWQTGGSTRFPGGHVRDSGYGTQHHLLRAAFSTKSGLWDIDTGLSRTRDTGTPALTMDMIKDDGYRVGLEYAGQPTFGSLSARFYHHGVSHQMNNYSLRPLATGMMPMVSNANSGDFGFNLDTSMPRGRSREHGHRHESGHVQSRTAGACGNLRRMASRLVASVDDAARAPKRHRGEHERRHRPFLSQQRSGRGDVQRTQSRLRCVKRRRDDHRTLHCKLLQHV